jgi:hypothetical protein
MVELKLLLYMLLLQCNNHQQGLRLLLSLQVRLPHMQLLAHAIVRHCIVRHRTLGSIAR